MNRLVVSDIKIRIAWRILEVLAKMGIGWVMRKINNWESKRLQLGLEIMDNPEVVLDGLQNKNPYLLVTLVLWSSIPSKLRPERVIGIVEAKEFANEIRWEKEGEAVYKHGICDIKLMRNNWIFYIPTPIDVLKKNVSLWWKVSFTVTFQHGLSKTFSEMKFKMRDSDSQEVSKL